MSFQSDFASSNRKHILMLTTHGVHQWNVVPGLTDTGGQNVFVNQFTEELVRQEFKVTIANRGGYPHPVSGILQTGASYKDQFQRIVYLEDGLEKFVRKEEMGDQVDRLASHLGQILSDETSKVDLIISHYWDAAAVGERYRERNNIHVPHVWVPHSLGAIKKRNMAENHWEPLRINERIRHELKILPKVDRVASTSPIISDSLQQDYHYLEPVLWLPPCVSPNRYFPHEVSDDAEVWKLLSQASGLAVEAIQKMSIVTEISRTDATKRKDILIKAFTCLRDRHPNTLLVITIDRRLDPLGPELIKIIYTLDIRAKVAVLGSVWDQLPDIYAISDIYCTPSIMEGFGMSAQEAAATGVPVISSSLVPFATQYLHREALDISSGEPASISIGQGAIIVRPDDISGFVKALDLLLSDEVQRQSMGNAAYQLTIPRFTWPNTVNEFLNALPNR